MGFSPLRVVLENFLRKHLLKLILSAVVCLILYGILDLETLATILALFVGLRFMALGAEAFRREITSEQWVKLADDIAHRYVDFTPEERAEKAAALNLDADISANDLARAEVVEAFRNYIPPRVRWELAAEALGAIAFAIFIPVDIALWGRNIFSLRVWQGWEGAIIAVLCAALYALPHQWLKAPEHSIARRAWWVAPFALSLLCLLGLIETRHPYLNPFNPDRHRLAAERVLSLDNNVSAGRFADWVMRYAKELDQNGDSKKAIYFYKAGLRLDSNDLLAYQRLTALEAAVSGNSEADVPPPASFVPYWTSDNPVTKMPRGRIDSRLETVDGCTVVIVPVGDVPDELLDAVGFVIYQELALPVIVSPDPLPLPPYTRKRGLATEPQWDADVLVQNFVHSINPFPRGPIRYLLITMADIYMGDSNFIFSISWNYGALLSAVRLGDHETGNANQQKRTAQQAICALLKSFNIPASMDRNCVTSYSRSLMEFDAKGIRPNAETMKLFRQAVEEENRRWQRSR